jgi:hypothetical protein
VKQEEMFSLLDFTGKTVVHKKDRKNSVSKRNIDQFIEKTENKLKKFDSDKSAVDSTRSSLS